MDLFRETFKNYPVYSLSEVATSLHQLVERAYPQPIFIKAEIIKLNFYPRSGHCYPELVEKEGDQIKAEMRGIIWASYYQRINERFLKITGEPLKENIRILFLASVVYSETRGLALHIQDVEPAYTLGEMAKNRNAVINRLKQEGVFDLNRRLKMPTLPKRVAVISVETSKGYSDFISTLKTNRKGYCFETELFPTILQGDKAIAGITTCLTNIERRREEFDCVVIVRGGGGDVGLSCYDDYGLSLRVATFPIPIMTGIGHSTNKSVTDMVAHTYKITPTDVAFALIDYFQNFDEEVMKLQARMVERSKLILSEHKNRLLRLDSARKISAPTLLSRSRDALSQLTQTLILQSKDRLQGAHKSLQESQYKLSQSTSKMLSTTTMSLSSVSDRLCAASIRITTQQQDGLALMEAKIALLHPDNILKRGFSITRFQGKAVTEADKLSTGDEIETQTYQGVVRSVVQKRNGKQ